MKGYPIQKIEFPRPKTPPLYISSPQHPRLQNLHFYPRPTPWEATQFAHRSINRCLKPELCCIMDYPEITKKLKMYGRVVDKPKNAPRKPKVKKLPGISGIYTITSPHGRVYIGQSKNVEGRLKGHKSDLRNGKHGCEDLQEDWNKFGEDSFVWKVVEQCEPGDLIETETKHLTHAHREGEHLYNKHLDTNLSGLFVPIKYRDIVSDVVALLDRGAISEIDLCRLLSQHCRH